MGILIGGALVLMIITMGILFSYVRYRFMPVLLVAIGLVTSLGLMGLAGIQLNMAVIGAFPVLIGLGIDYAIQFHARFDEEIRKGSLENAVFMTVTRTGPAVMYAMLATSMGFLAMFVSYSPDDPLVRSCLHHRHQLLLLDLMYRHAHPRPPPEIPAQAADRRNAMPWERMRATPSSTEREEKEERLLLRPVPDGRIDEDREEPDPDPARGRPCRRRRVLRSTRPSRSSSDENTFVPSDMPAKINMEKVTRVIGATSTADFFVQGSRVTDLDTMIWMKEFQDYEVSHHAEITGSTSIVTYVLQYNGGVMPETQDQLDAVLAKIPEDTKESYLASSLSGIIRFSTDRPVDDPDEGLQRADGKRYRVP